MGRLFIVATPIGNLSDLTARAGDVLAAADHILSEDTRRSGVLLRHIKVRGRPLSLHAHNEASRIPGVLRWLSAGDDVALVSDAGTPLVSDPGARLVRAAVEAGHDVVAVPGPSAVLAGLVASGLPCVPFTFAGFLPRKSGKRERALDQIAGASGTTVLFESAVRLHRLLDDLRERAGPSRPVAVCRELTKVHEEVFRGTLNEAADRYRDNPPRGEVTVVVAGRSASGGAGLDERADADKVEAMAVALLAEGMPPPATAKALARQAGISRSAAYDAVRRASEAARRAGSR